MFSYYQNLGFNNPYYFVRDGKFNIQTQFKDSLAQYGTDRKIDPISVVELLNKNFSFGDRTVIENISKTPWLAKPNEELNEWEFAPNPIHGKGKEDPKIIAENFFDLICREIEGYLVGKHTVGVLLSGGMDSRMVAGALDFLIKTKRINVKVTALTWGNTNTRDVIYAERIAKRLGWEWKHFLVTGKDLLKNIRETGIHGCEYSPIHLHGIPQIRDTTQLDVVLAGSYGDSIGRAEYGGIHVSKLPKVNENMMNVGNLIIKDVYHSTLSIIEKDIEDYHSLFPAKEQYMQNEYDYQLHYMRRQLNPCMELLNETSDFFQVFTHPDVFRHIWKIDSSLRNDDLYKYMLTLFKTDLSDIPWARTGLKYGSKEGNADNYLKRHHTYVQIMNYEILDQMKEFALSDEIKTSGIFNYTSIEELFRLAKKYPLNSFFYTEKLAWIASLGILMDVYKIQPTNRNKIDDSQMRKLTREEYMPKYYRNKLGGYLRTLKIIK